MYRLDSNQHQKFLLVCRLYYINVEFADGGLGFIKKSGIGGVSLSFRSSRLAGTDWRRNNTCWPLPFQTNDIPGQSTCISSNEKYEDVDLSSFYKLPVPNEERGRSHIAQRNYYKTGYASLEERVELNTKDESKWKKK